MNGRIYDPLLGRFLSADLMVPHPGSLQSYNRYSYVCNNPLSLVDPSGYDDQPADQKKKNDEKEQQKSIVVFNPKTQKGETVTGKASVIDALTAKMGQEGASIVTAQSANGATPGGQSNGEQRLNSGGHTTGSDDGITKSSSNASPTAEGSASEKGTPEASTPGSNITQAEKPKGIGFVRLSNYKENDQQREDTNSLEWDKLIPALAAQLEKDGTAHPGQLQYFVAHNPAEAEKIFCYLNANKLTPVISSHGCKTDDDIKGIFGMFPYEKDKFIAKINGAVGDGTITNNTKWYSCDELHGGRPPQTIFDKDARPDIINMLFDINKDDH